MCRLKRPVVVILNSHPDRMTHADAVSRQIIKERFGFCASFLELRDDYLGLVFRNASLNIGRRTLYQIPWPP